MVETKGLFERREGVLDTSAGRFTELRGSMGVDYSGDNMTGMSSPSGAFNVKVSDGKLTVTATEGYRGQFQVSSVDGRALDNGAFTPEDTTRVVELDLAKYHGEVVRVTTF